MNALLECAPKEGTRSRKRVNFSLIDRPDTESRAYEQRCTYERAHDGELNKVSPNERVSKTKRAFDDKYRTSNQTTSEKILINEEKTEDKYAIIYIINL